VCRSPVRAVSNFFGEFAHAFSHLVVWAYLLGILTFLAQTAVRSQAWRNLLVAMFPGSSVRWRDAYGATRTREAPRAQQP
jgi:hypothetical protein